MTSQVRTQFSTSSCPRPLCGQESFYKSRLSVAICLSLGDKLLSKGQFKEANDAFNSAQHFLTTSSLTASSELRAALDRNFSHHNEIVSNQSPSSTSTRKSLSYNDSHDEDECDVGPITFNSAIVPEDVVRLDVNVLQLVIAYNKAVAYQASKNYFFSSQLYKFITGTIGSYLACGNSDATLAHLAMRAHNNMGHIECNERSEDHAYAEFEKALAYARRNVSQLQMEDAAGTSTIEFNSLLSPTDQELEIATVLSNWCRTRWMMGKIDDSVHAALQDVFQIRSTHLPPDHPDVAAAHFYIGRAEFSRGSNKKSMEHLLCYLRVALARFQEKNFKNLNNTTTIDNEKNTSIVSDPTEGLIYLLQIQNEGKNDEISQDLVWGVRTLQEKRQTLGPIHSDVATVLNYIGTLLFRRQELDYALFFFVQELFVEERLKTQSDSEKCSNHNVNVSISVTCNNIGRILQELERFREAKHYYQRSLGDDKHLMTSSPCLARKANGMCENKLSDDIIDEDNISNIPAPAMNLYSTVWYNLGLIHDKMGAFNEAIRAFRMSLNLRRAMLGHKHSDVSCLYYNIGVLQMEQNQLDEATESFREALAYRHVSGKGQLNDVHVIKTLQKLSSMHKAKGNVNGALVVYKDIISVLATTNDFDQFVRNREIATAMRDIADLYQAQGNLQHAVKYASGSVDLFQTLRRSASADENSMEVDTRHDSELSSIEEEIHAFLLFGSLQHELCEPLNAQNIFSETARMLHSNLSTIANNSPSAAKSKTSLIPLLEVSMMLSSPSCAPEA